MGRFTPQKTGVFWKKVLAAEKKPFLGGIRKWLAHSVFCSKQKNLAVDGLKKSTPQKNLALTFFEKAFVQKWKKRQNSQNRMHKTGWSVQKLGFFSHFLSHPMDAEVSETARKGHFSFYFASSPWRFFVELFCTKNCKHKICVFMRTHTFCWIFQQ